MNSFAPYLLLLSGFSALVYQVVWVRLLGLSIGMTSASVGAVLAAVFLGMSLGSWFSGRAPARWQGRLKSFAIVEGIVGVSALALLPVLLNLDHLMALMPSLGSQLWFRFMIATLLLAIPAAGLGAAYPLMANARIRHQQEITGGFASLYALHTVGAVCGALAAAFFLIPWWGLDGALYTAVIINLLVAVTALRLDTGESASPEVIEETVSPPQRTAWMGLFALCVTGLSAVAVQVGWTKYLAIFTESTFFGFAILLSMFLGGMVIGTWAIKFLQPRIAHPNHWLAGGMLTLALAMLFTRSGLAYLPAIETYVEEQQFRDVITAVFNYGSVLLVILPTAFMFGVLFPLSLSSYCGKINTLGRRAGQGYAANTLAGLVGAVAAGMWLIPSYGTDSLLLSMAIVVTLSSMLLIVGMQKKIQKMSVSILALLLLILSPLMPEISFERMIICMECSEGAYRQGGEPKFHFVKEGHSGVISLVTYDGGNFILENNGLQESRISLTRSHRSEVLLGILPHLFKPDAKNAFVVGYGSGTSAEVLAATNLEAIRVVELEPAIVEAMQVVKEMDPAIVNDVTAVGRLKKGDLKAMDNPRVTLDYNDARNTLLMEPTKYDIIVSQPSHPWRAGAAPLFTREFFHIVHSRLEEGGVFTQWLNLVRMDVTTLKAVLKAFFEEFPRGIVFSNKQAPDLFLLGSDQPLELDFDTVSKLVMRPEMVHYSWSVIIERPILLLEQYYLMTREEALALVGDTPANSDLNLLSEIRLGRMKDKAVPEQDLLLLLEPFTKR